jgi:hypothetical protein
MDKGFAAEITTVAGQCINNTQITLFVYLFIKFLLPTFGNPQGPGQGYFLNGHKWFTSAPMCDAFLTLAQVVSYFLFTVKVLVVFIYYIFFLYLWRRFISRNKQ